MCLAQGHQRSDTCEAGTRGPSVSSQALYHWATSLPRSVEIQQRLLCGSNIFLSTPIIIISLALMELTQKPRDRWQGSMHK